MKVFVVALLAFAAFGTSTAAPRNAVSDGINAILKKIKDALPEKLSLTDKTITLPDNKIETGKIVINELSLSGLKENDIAAEDQGTDFHVDVSGAVADIIAIVDVDLDLSGILKANGNVKISVDLKSTNVKGAGDINEDGTEVTDFDLLVTLGSADIKITGVVDDDYSKQLSKELSEAVPEVVNQITTGIEQPFGRIAKFVLNLVLKLLS